MPALLPPTRLPPVSVAFPVGDGCHERPCPAPPAGWARGPRVAPTTRRGGLNIVGPFEGTSVEADVARRLASALRAEGVPISTTSYHRDDRDLGSPWSHRGPSDFPFDVNLLVVHPDHMTDFVLDSGPGLFQGRYTIGLWVCDLPVPSSVDGRRGAHGARSLDPHVVGSAVCLIGARRAGPLRRRPGRWEPSRRDRRLARPPGGLVFASVCRLRRRLHPAESAGRPGGVLRGLFSDGWSPSDHRHHPCRPVPRGARVGSSAPPKGRPDVEAASARPVVGRGRGIASWPVPTAISRCTGPMAVSERWPRRCHGGRSRW